MQTTWRATLGHSLLAAGTGMSLLLALAIGLGGGTAGWMQVGLATAVLCLVAGLVTVRLHYRETNRFRLHLNTGLTHHLRTSLAHIQSYNEMLLLGADHSEEERQQWLEVIGREAERLGAAVENLLLIVGTRTPKAYPVRRAVDLGALLEDAACGYSAPDTPELYLESGPPPGIIVEADPAALRHALSNLFHSIGRFGLPDGKLSATLTSDGTTATIMVGLTPAEGGSPRRLSGRNVLREADLEGATGAGFGLEIAVVQHVARAHGGRAVPFHDHQRSGYRLDLPIARA